MQEQTTPGTDNCKDHKGYVATSLNPSTGKTASSPATITRLTASVTASFARRPSKKWAARQKRPFW
ncbi:MAG: hypothetical protein SCH66_14135 [Methanolobus sp.]|nr:hypothetical protein [Methanolobus sp.]